MISQARAKTRDDGSWRMQFESVVAGQDGSTEGKKGLWVCEEKPTKFLLRHEGEERGKKTTRPDSRLRPTSLIAVSPTGKLERES